MRHHRYNPNYKFINPPIDFNKYTDREMLQYCLGGTLYMPGTKRIIDKILNKQLNGLTTMVMCFEDAIPEKDLAEAETNVINHIDILSKSLQSGALLIDDLPLFFLRTRSPQQFKDFVNKISFEHLKVLTGFVFPKLDSDNGYKYFEHLEYLNHTTKEILYGMPILEGINLALYETRSNELANLKVLFSKYKHYILNLRVGATDFSSIFGVRRGINYSIYDILTIRDCLSAILNCFNRADNDYVISAPVWEYFLADKRENIEHLLNDDIHLSLMKRTAIVNEAIDGLLREVILDKANGFVGKTIIHPSHLKYVNAMQAVIKEEFDDSVQIMHSNGGVFRGSNNKMNETNPHKNWAKKTILRAKAYGVIENDTSYLELIQGAVD